MSPIVDRLCRRLLPGSQRHVPDRALADLFCGDLPPIRRWSALRHLAICSYCRVRKQGLDGPRAERMIELYSQSIQAEETLSRREARGEFAAWLDRQSQLEQPRLQGLRYRLVPSAISLRGHVPALSFGLVLGLVMGAPMLHLWWRAHVPQITANALLVHAERWESPKASGAGVAYQAIEVRSAEGVVKRSLYRDLKAQRRQQVSVPKDPVALSRKKTLQAKFDRAGVDWEQPLSATSYQDWHDRQHERSDRIAFSGRDLLALTTTIPQGEIASETLMVRKADFHPVRRLVDFRDRETIDIAELEFRLLPWSAVDTNVFEPVVESVAPSAGPRSGSQAAPGLPALPNDQQLDLTELTARLILNQLQADSGEQIEVRRTARGVEVVGLVESEERKRELRMQLISVPRLRVSIQTFADLKDDRSAAAVPVQVESASLPDSPSILEAYFKDRGRSVEDANRASAQLLGDALVISRESHSIAGLGTRFRADGTRAAIVAVTVTELLYSHRDRLRGAVLEERKLLSQVAKAPLSREVATDDGTVADEQFLTNEAAHNLELVQNLTQTNRPSSALNPEVVLSEIEAALNSLDFATDELYAKYRQPAAPTGKD